MTPPRLALDAVDVTLSGRLAVAQASVLLESGRLVALVGPNGAGKTSLLRAIAGLVPIHGTVRIDGTDRAGLSARALARRVAYLPQGQQVAWALAVRDVVALGRYPQGASDPARLNADDARAVAAAMARMATDTLADRSILSLSGGERARVMLARALAVEASILLADEPTASLDPRHQLGVMNDLRAEARRGALVIAATHDLGLAARYADSIILLHEGRVVAHDAPEAVLTPEALERVYGVRALIQRIDGELALTPWSILP